MIRMAKMKKAKDIVVGDVLVKIIDGKTKYSKVKSVESVVGRKGGERIRIHYYDGFCIVRHDTEIEVA